MRWDPRKFDPEWPFEVTKTDFGLGAETTALLVVDMQVDQMTIAPESPLARGHPQIVASWNQRINETVVPNIRRLLDRFRDNKREIVFTRNGNMTDSGLEMTERLRNKRASGPLPSHRESPGYQIDRRLSPRRSELVVDKLTSGAFTASILDHALRNMGIRSVVITGILTDACVLGTARTAAELGYNTVICEDACATFTRRAHDEALMMHARIFGRVDSTDGILSELNGRGPQRANA